MTLSRIRKALVAGASATLAGVLTAVVEGGAPNTGEAWVGLIAGALGLGLAAAAATYGIRNTGAGINAVGSETTPEDGGMGTYRSRAL